MAKISELLKKLDAVDYQLDKLAADDVDELKQSLTGEDPFLRHDLAQVLVDVIGAPAKSILLDALKSESWQAREVAAENLGFLGDATVIPALIETLRDTDKMVYEAAVYALRELVEINPSPELVQALSDENLNVRAGAAFAIGDKGGVAVIPALFECVRQGGIGGDVSDFERMRDVLVKIGKPAIPLLLQGLKDQNRQLRGFAAETLGWMGDPEVVPNLAEALNDEDRDVYYHVVGALQYFGYMSVPVLIEALHHASEDIRLYAVNALIHIGTPEALAAVEQWRGGQQG